MFWTIYDKIQIIRQGRFTIYEFRMVWMVVLVEFGFGYMNHRDAGGQRESIQRLHGWHKTMSAHCVLFLY